MKIMVLCATKYDFMVMSEVSRDNILSSGPARFHSLSAFHRSITSRQSYCFGTKLSTSFPSALFETLIKLKVVVSHISNFYHTDQRVKKNSGNPSILPLIGQHLPSICPLFKNIIHTVQFFMNVFCVG